jgi:hypothetical protein
MTWRTERSRGAARIPLGSVSATVIATLLAVAAFAAPSAPATVTGEVADAAGSVVESATGTAVPPVPTAPPPAPPAPATPPPPPVQVEAGKAPTEAASPPSQSHPNAVTATAGAAAEEPASDAGGSTAAATGSLTEGTPPDPARSADSRPSDPPGGPGTGRHSTKLSDAAPVGWFLSHVWPAVALERYRGLLSTFIARLEAGAPLPLFEAAAGSSPSTPSGGTQADRPSTGQQIGTPASASAHPSLGDTLAEGARTLLYAAAAALLALLAFAAWAELSAALRSRSVTDRWHRGV